ncbi:bifunctional hydroxymethylpyrimidine kinase/phosphomethylpyrimidine kinase [Nocardioides houyundeii]|uniref:bifunctional hydroxymethylpyrimidine kinase/phosphomethylpyrimidine kinase n=1 Tax=Nocardioides houyundeii TaxID=2045452 RepID=UPI000C77CD2D|nr:bifunctional hydroxymethylpyrimidine kinase/phosphomethylpyrimidine kinase [Nocardioides houyundeii]
MTPRSGRGTPPVVLTIAGTDSGGAAGVAADLATIGQLGAHGACVVTAVTAQDTTGVRAVHPVPLEVVSAQLDAVLEDLPVACVKTGMLGSADVVALVATRVRDLGLPLVVDPVLVATSGAVLGDTEVVAAYREHLLPVATVATPNGDEAAALAGLRASAPDLARALTRLGCSVVVTGGPEGRDWLARPGGEPLSLRHPAVATTNDHGTGCTHSSALATRLASGVDLVQAVAQAAEFTTSALRRSRQWELGRGRGPVAHTAEAAQPVAGQPRRGICHDAPGPESER